MVAWPRREFSIAQRAQFAAEDLFGDRDAILVEHPLRQIDQLQRTTPCRIAGVGPASTTATSARL